MITLIDILSKLPKCQYVDIVEVNSPSIDYTNKEVARYADIGMIYSGYVEDLSLEIDCYINNTVLKCYSCISEKGQDYITILIQKD